MKATKTKREYSHQPYLQILLSELLFSFIIPSVKKLRNKVTHLWALTTLNSQQLLSETAFRKIWNSSWLSRYRWLFHGQFSRATSLNGVCYYEEIVGTASNIKAHKAPGCMSITAEELIDEVVSFISHLCNGWIRTKIHRLSRN